MSSEETPRVDTSSAAFRIGVLAVVLLTFVSLFGYSIHERNVAQQLAAEKDQTATALKQTQAQIEALNAKLDALTSTHATVAPAAPRQMPHVHNAVVHHSKADPRWKKLQAQVDAQGKAIDDTKQDLASTRTELQGSIGKNHSEIVALQRKGERNYYEFDIEKSKQFSHAGPVGVSLRKANTKHQYADLELMVDDRQLSKKHLNLYEPAVFYTDGSERPMEIVVNSVTKNHIHGYISTPKYRASELAAMTSDATPTSLPNNDNSTPAQLHHR
ncbi:MAG TPA: hypothetical protein VG498_13865 [Terriglobales bacterium]|nr:hypothetical protein [Terriglobales bacterium]